MLTFLGTIAAIATLSNQPVSVISCDITTQAMTVSQGDYETQAPLNSTVSIKFKNTSAEAIRAVTFDVAENGGVKEVHDVGEFSPGVTIAHEFSQLAVGNEGPASCHVASIQYQDGTVASQ